MNNDIIALSEKTTISKPLILHATDAALGELRENGVSMEHFFSKVSGAKSILISAYRGEDESERYKLHTDEGSLSLARSLVDTNSFSIIYYSPRNYRDISFAISQGKRFAISNEFSIVVKSNTYGIRCAFINGFEYDPYEVNRWPKGAVQTIVDCFNQEDISDEEEPEAFDENSDEYKDYQALLDTAENYANLASEFERIIGDRIGRISYTRFEPVAYDRKDRVAYNFFTEKIDDDGIKKGVIVDVVNDKEQKSSAEIVQLSTEENTTVMTLLFLGEIDKNELSEVGWIELSFNTVVLDVQKNAIDRIRTNRAKAKYIPTVLGMHSTSGFDNNDFAELEQDLQQKKCPPNGSQVAAIKAGINAKDVYLVMGPPGTGKTTVIGEWVKYFIGKQKKRVLISSQNNKAVDNVIERLAEETWIDTLRIGSEAKIQPSVVPFMFENKITALREKISASASDSCKTIEKDNRSWTGFAKKEITLIKLIGEWENAKRAALEEAKSSISKLYEGVHSIREKYYQLDKQIDEHVKGIQSLKRSTDIYYESRGVFKEIIRLFLNSKIVLREEHEKKLRECVEKQGEIIDVFPKARDALKKAIMDFYNTRMGTLYPLYEGTFVLTNELAAEREKLQDTFGVFKDDVPNDINYFDKESVQESIKRILSSNKRCNDIVQIISDWKDSMIGTQNYAIKEILLDSVDLVGATCIGINSQKKFKDLDFDVTIIDEAGQIQIQNALVPMSVSNKLIMLGDHKQIPPSVDQGLSKLCEENDVDTDLLGMSLFEKMFNEVPSSNKTLLDTQYRMPGEIAEIISEWFYGGEYKSPDTKYGSDPFLPRLSKSNLVIIDTSKVPARGETKVKDQGCYNTLEAELIERIVALIGGNDDINAGDIGIISAYAMQVATIREKLKNTIGAQKVQEIVATLDSFQGQERDIIIYSFTKSSRTPAHIRRIGFLSELRRLNVAMTRCKEMLIMIGDMDFLSSCEHIDKDEDGNEVYEKSEKQFSDFIKHVLKKVREGKGEIIPAEELMR